MSAHVQWSITHGDEVTVEAGPCYGRMKVALSVGDERFVVTGTRQQLIDQVLSPMALAITSAESAEEKPCELGWGCTDLECPEHGAALRAGPEDAA